MEQQFEKASRQKLRFETTKGSIMVEDLWDLPLTSTRGAANLDDIAKGLNRQLKDTDTESFVKKPAASDETLQVKFDLVKHIIDVRLAENEAASKARVAGEKKQQILAIIDRKKNEQLEGKSLEELEVLANTL